MIILEENFKWHLEAFASELFIYIIYFIYMPDIGYEYNPAVNMFDIITIHIVQLN